jgi:hypothetical protein
MSAGHHHKSSLSERELDDLLDKALAHPKIKERLAKPYKLVTSFDIALLGSSAIGGHSVYLDRHLHARGCPYGVILVRGKPLDTKPGLVRHERLEQALEDIFGWHYIDLAHPVAQHWEERDYRRKGFDPRAVERAFRPFIKADEHERITRTPTDLDMRPLLAPPKSSALIAHINATAQKEKRSHESVGYVAQSKLKAHCAGCIHFVEPKFGGPACTGVQSEISPAGWCRRFRKGSLALGEDNGHQRADIKNAAVG